MGLGHKPMILFLFFLLASISAVPLVSPVKAQTASALLREDDTLPGQGTVSAIVQPTVNHAGGYSVTTNSNDAGSIISHVWGNAGGGPGAVIISEGDYAGYEQVSFEAFHGLSDAGSVSYSAVATETSSGTTGLDGMWIDTTPVLMEDDPIASLPFRFSTFNSRPGISADGQPYWVGGFASTPDGATENRALFLGIGLVPLLMGGDPIGGIAESVINGSGGIDFNYRFSQFATNYIMESLVDSGSSSNDGVVVMNGDAVLAGGGLMREGSPVSAFIGGLLGENWEFFDYFGVNETGLFMVTGNSSAAAAVNEFVFVAPRIVLREGDVVSTPSGDVTINGAIESASMNEQGDWAVTWDVDDALTNNLEALLLNGELLLKEGDSVDLDGDGTAEPGSLLVDFTGIATLAVGDRDEDEFVSVYFTADIDTEGTPTTSDDIEGLFRITVQLEGTNQPPVAVCQDVTVAAGPSCLAEAEIDGGSFDPDDDPITLVQDPSGPYGLGETLVTLTVTDDQLAGDSCTATVTVVPEPLLLAVGRDALTWGPPVCDNGYDVVRGALEPLRQSDGDFSVATLDCLANDVAATSVAYTGEPAADQCEWYLARRIDDDGNGSYDSAGGQQAGPRDDAIAASGADCP